MVDLFRFFIHAYGMNEQSKPKRERLRVDLAFDEAMRRSLLVKPDKKQAKAAKRKK